MGECPDLIPGGARGWNRLVRAIWGNPGARLQGTLKVLTWLDARLQPPGNSKTDANLPLFQEPRSEKISLKACTDPKHPKNPNLDPTYPPILGLVFIDSHRGRSSNPYRWIPRSGSEFLGTIGTRLGSGVVPTDWEPAADGRFLHIA